jgi:glycosyltransferase involved in cell wall biosynthesis
MDLELPRYSVAALPSHREGTPRFLLEAASCGLPVVTTDAPGCRETLIHGKTGFMVPLNRPDRLAQVICKILTNGSLRQRMGYAGRQWVKERFDMRIINATYVNLYRELGVNIGPMVAGEEPGLQAA